MGPVSPGVWQEASRLLAPPCAAAAAFGGVTDPRPRCEAAAGMAAGPDAVEDDIATKLNRRSVPVRKQGTALANGVRSPGSIGSTLLLAPRVVPEHVVGLRWLLRWYVCTFTAVSLLSTSRRRVVVSLASERLSTTTAKATNFSFGSFTIVTAAAVLSIFNSSAATLAKALAARLVICSLTSASSGLSWPGTPAGTQAPRPRLTQLAGWQLVRRHAVFGSQAAV